MLGEVSDVYADSTSAESLHQDTQRTEETNAEAKTQANIANLLALAARGSRMRFSAHHDRILTASRPHRRNAPSLCQMSGTVAGRPSRQGNKQSAPLPAIAVIGQSVLTGRSQRSGLILAASPALRSSVRFTETVGVLLSPVREIYCDKKAPDTPTVTPTPAVLIPQKCHCQSK